MPALNYHHLRYFRAIARERSLTRAAERLHVSQSALSIQLRKLEQRLGHALFDREHRRLTLTPAGKLVLDYADHIFTTGDELLATLEHRPNARKRVLRVGAVATLSRNFQLRLLRPLLGKNDIELVLRSGGLRELLAQLRAHTLDLVLTNQLVQRDAETPWHTLLLDEQPVSLVGPPRRSRKPFRFPQDIAARALLLPSVEHDFRLAFDRLLETLGVRPTIAAEVDDMAMLRVLAREHVGLALVPRVVVQDELAAGTIVEHYRLPQIRESFYAITAKRRFADADVRKLLAPFTN